MNEQNLSNLMIGIISGVITTIIIWFFVLIYNKIIKVRIKELLYKGIDLEGEWHADLFITKQLEEEEEEEKHIEEKIKEFTITIKQNAYQISGDMIIKNINEDKEVFSFYKYTGFIRDNYVILNYLPKSKKCIGLGALILAVREGGKCLKGDICGTALSDMELLHINEIHLIRK